jgi:glutathione synthase/RimK-type ligase-like ATP-grasp enzyme
MKVLILREQRDESARKVILWLQRLNVHFLDISGDETIDIIDDIEIDNDGVKIWFCHKGERYNLCNFKVLWFRRAHFMFNLPKLNLKDVKNQKVIPVIQKHLDEELLTLNTFIYDHLKNITIVVNDPLVYNFNKLIGLVNARKAGLKIPDTLITKRRSNVVAFQEDRVSLVTKNIQDVFSFHDEIDKISWNQSTKVVDTDQMPNQFFYSLFQNNLRKQYEIRCFVFMNTIFCIAMFTQKSDKSQNDSRLLDERKMMRIVPYKLPSEIESSIRRFMNFCRLNSGSIDLVYDGIDFIFLEVNPVGQFDYVSGYGNYHIEKFIAQEFKKIGES